MFRTRLIRLIGGLFLYSLGSVLMTQANIGALPWYAFCDGLANKISLSLGMTSFFMSVLCLGIAILFKEKMGIGTIAYMLLVGMFTEFLLRFNLVPLQGDSMTQFGEGTAVSIIAMVLIVFATYLYISAGFGASPIDSLAVVLYKKRPLRGSFAGARMMLECLFLALGMFLDGPVGMLTILYAMIVTFLFLFIFMLLDFDPIDIVHESLVETIRSLRS